MPLGGIICVMKSRGGANIVKNHLPLEANLGIR